MHENRETSETSAAQPGSRSAGEGSGHTAIALIDQHRYGYSGRTSLAKNAAYYQDYRGVKNSICRHRNCPVIGPRGAVNSSSQPTQPETRSLRPEQNLRASCVRQPKQQACDA